MVQLLFAVSIAHEPVIPNAVESTGENVEEESPNELFGRENHNFLLTVVAVVPPVKLHLPVFDITAEARSSYEKALALTQQEPERQFL